MSFAPQISNTLNELNGLIVKSDSECNTALEGGVRQWQEGQEVWQGKRGKEKQEEK